MISERSVVSSAPEQVHCDLSGEIAILNLKSGIYYGLNSSGARIWHLLREPTTVDKIRDKLLEEYDVERERCEQDLLTLLRELAHEGLVEWKEPQDR